MRLTDAEWQIMNALWKRYPATAREIAENLADETQWAYTTIKTLLARLAAKNAVSEQKRGNTSVYEPLVSLKKARRTALRTFLNQGFGGTVEPLLNFLAEERKLTDKQRQELARILQNEEDRKGGKP
ncbi:MAG: BlaI/MecI/CopY family transcriptional regulator [Candidatus Aminicenantes bacterium]|nr:BlaI/MecI/CopY family transcriptional regulator [Candidatus Aminicenantes bacterium]MCJ7487292.1 BlaI/MecI/CopY family transcriptional regulator [Candidatus Aminicenantes bacterium]